MQALRTAALQLQSGADSAASLARALALVTEALEAGAELIVLPEGYGSVRHPTSPGSELPSASGQGQEQDLDGLVQHPFVSPFVNASQAAVIVLGGLPIQASEAGKTTNSAVVLAGGRAWARYDKVHLFQTKLAGGLDERVRVAAGTSPVAVAWGPWVMGLSICYDLRFPEHFQQLADAGANLMLVPSAFTAQTGPAHWETLLRARAIECQSWVVAPAQWGPHEGAQGRVSHGDTMIIDPWGRVVSRREREEGLVLAELDLGAVSKARAAIPVQRDRPLHRSRPAPRVELPPRSDWAAPAGPKSGPFWPTPGDLSSSFGEKEETP